MAEVRINTTGTLKLYENDNTSYIQIASPSSLGANRTITLPDADVNLTSIGITSASIWRLTTGFTGDADPIASNWEVQDDASYGSLGSAMSESSGIFTFPSTGYWLVQFVFYTSHTSADNEYTEGIIQATINNSSYDTVASTAQGTSNGQGEYGVGVNSTIIDVTDVANVKVKFKIDMEENGSTVHGSTGNNATHVLFLRLGDT